MKVDEVKQTIADYYTMILNIMRHEHIDDIDFKMLVDFLILIYYHCYRIRKQISMDHLLQEVIDQIYVLDWRTALDLFEVETIKDRYSVYYLKYKRSIIADAFVEEDFLDSLFE